MPQLILVVDDEPKVARLARDYLEKNGFRVTIAADGQSALAIARREKPDLVILCPATARHADYVERVAAHKVHMLVEKPFAASLRDADRMIAAAQENQVMLAINWPLRWVASHCTAYRLLKEGAIGRLQELHYYDGNRGPLWHGADKVEARPTPTRWPTPSAPTSSPSSSPRTPTPSTW